MSTGLPPLAMSSERRFVSSWTFSQRVLLRQITNRTKQLKRRMILCTSRVHSLGGSRVEESTHLKSPVKLPSAIRRVQPACPLVSCLVSRKSGFHIRGDNWYRRSYQLGGCTLMSVALDQVTCFPTTSACGDNQPATVHRHVFRAPRSAGTCAGRTLAAPIGRPRNFGDRVI